MLRPENFAKINTAAGNALKIIATELGPAYANKGIYLRVYYTPAFDAGVSGLDELFAGWIGGEGNSFMLTQFARVSNEKARLLSMYMKDFDLTSSSQNPDPEEKELCVQFAGAVTVMCLVDELGLRPSNLIFSVAGLKTGIEDETVALLTAMELPWHTQGATEIIAKTNNSIAARYVFS